MAPPTSRREAEAVYGAASDAHPGVRYLYEQVYDPYVGGGVEGIEPPSHYDFENLRDDPEKLRRLFTRLGWRQVLAFRPPGAIHRRGCEIVLAAAKESQVHVLLHPFLGRRAKLQICPRTFGYETQGVWLPGM